VKLIVVADPNGFIHATAPVSVTPRGKGAPRGASMTPHTGHAHKIEVPAEIMRLGAAELHRSYRVALRGKPRLVKIDAAAPRRKPNV
jgi:hypothetical protein